MDSLDETQGQRQDAPADRTHPRITPVAAAAADRDGRDRSAPASDDERGFHRDILRAQQDAVLLLNFVSGRKERSFLAGTADLPGCQGWTLQDLLRVLAMPPHALQRSPQDWATLLAAIDHLTDLARPATVESIRITRRYVEGKNAAAHGESGGVDRYRWVVFWLKGLYYVLAPLGLAVAILTLVVLHHVMDGQMILKKIEALRTDQTLLQPRLAQAFPEGEDKPRPCAKVPPGTSLNAIQSGLCDAVADLGKKMDLTYLQLGVWNLTTDKYFYVSNLLRPDMSAVLAAEALERVAQQASDRNPPEASLPADVPRVIRAAIAAREDWDRTELRAASMLFGLTNYFVPTLLGFVGATVFVFRRQSKHLDEWTLDSRERFLIGLRPFLGMMLGGLASIVFEARGAEIQNFNYSIGFLAFLGGYSVQAIFDLLDNVIMRGSRPAASQPAAIPAPTAPTTARTSPG